MLSSRMVRHTKISYAHWHELFPLNHEVAQAVLNKTYRAYQGIPVSFARGVLVRVDDERSYRQPYIQDTGTGVVQVWNNPYITSCHAEQ